MRKICEYIKMENWNQSYCSEEGKWCFKWISITDKQTTYKMPFIQAHVFHSSFPLSYNRKAVWKQYDIREFTQ